MKPTEKRLLFVEKYRSFGQEKFHSFLLIYAETKIENNDLKESPDQELLSYYFKFLSYYRKDGDNVNLEIAKTFRKASHIIYRRLLKKNLTTPNDKFLRLVK